MKTLKEDEIIIEKRSIDIDTLLGQSLLNTLTRKQFDELFQKEFIVVNADDLTFVSNRSFCCIIK